jgi:L-arginine dehydrogenase
MVAKGVDGMTRNASAAKNGPVFLRQEDFNARLPVEVVLDSLRDAFAAVAGGGAVQPPQSYGVIDGQVDVIWYPGILGTQNLFGAKLSPYLIKRKTGPKVTAWTVLCSTETGEPVLLCDSLALTIERTAATTALAIQLLKPQKARRLAVIGTGPVGMAHLHYASAVYDWSHVFLYSRNAESRGRALERVPSKLQPITEIADSAERAVVNSDVILLCTSSTTPVIDYRWLKPTQMFTSLTTTTPAAHEIAPEALVSLDVYCDYREVTPSTAGEMRIAAENHGWSPESVRSDLPELVSGKGRTPGQDRPIFFRSIGLGIEDIAIAAALLRQIESVPAGSPLR